MPEGPLSGPVHARQAREAAKGEGKEDRAREAGRVREANETDRGCRQERQEKTGTV
jgi:hypothetical protein